MIGVTHLFMTRLTTAQFIRMLVYFGLFLTPVLCLPAVLNMTTRAPKDGLPPGHEVIAIKAAKDILLLLMFSFLILDVLRGYPFVRDPFVWLLLCGIGISFCVSLFQAPAFLAVMGMRAISPFVLIFIGYRYVDMRALRRIVKILGVLLAIETCAAFIRAFYGVPVDGYNSLGLVARSSGTFASPSSWAVLISLLNCYIIGMDVSVYGVPRKRTWFVVGVSCFLVYLSGAGAGILAFAAFLCAYFLFLSKVHPYLKAALLPLLLVMPALILANLAFLTGRPSAFRSVESRLAIIMNVVSSMNLREMVTGKGLGVGTDVVMTIQRLRPEMLRGIDGAFVSDSLYAAILSQMGIIWLVVFLAFSVHIFRRSLTVRHHGVYPIVLLAVPSVLAGGSGSVTTEVFPVNWLLFLLYGMALNRPVWVFRTGICGCRTRAVPHRVCMS